jgi:hypothetical protein
MEHEKAAGCGDRIFNEASALLRKFEAANRRPWAIDQLGCKRLRLAQELESLVEEQITAFHAMLDLTGARDESERVLRLVRAFEFGAQLNGLLADELLDTDKANPISDELWKVYCRLEELGQQEALMPLLDNPNPHVRLNVAGPLLRTAGRDRAVAALRELNSDRYRPHLQSSAWTVLLMEGEETLEPEISA